MTASRPIALTCGDPAGIGPEIAARAYAALAGEVDLFLIGDPRHLPPGTAFTAIDGPDAARGATALPVLVHPFPEPAVPGRPSAANAAATVAVITRAVDLVRDGRAAALCTNPISKKHLRDHAGFAHPGHTEFLAHLAGGVPVAMMLAAPGLRVVPATIHLPLSAVPAALTAAAIESAIRLTDAALRRDFAIGRPRIAVAGLNPHAGEGGAMGDEEITRIAPLLARLRGEGFALAGPLPADTMFHPAARAGYDAAICMYHDQALIPVKTLDFAGAVNITLGLPFVRTSPDHGTAFDIAGRGLADPASLIAALRTARDMATVRGTPWLR